MDQSQQEAANTAALVSVIGAALFRATMSGRYSADQVLTAMRHVTNRLEETYASGGDQHQLAAPTLVVVGGRNGEVQ